MGLEAKGSVDISIRFFGIDVVEMAVASVPPDMEPFTEWAVVELPGMWPASKRALAERKEVKSEGIES